MSMVNDYLNSYCCDSDDVIRKCICNRSGIPETIFAIHRKNVLCM